VQGVYCHPKRARAAPGSQHSHSDRPLSFSVTLSLAARARSSRCMRFPFFRSSPDPSGGELVTDHTVQQYLPEPQRCFYQSRDRNISDQVRRHAISTVEELGVNAKEDSSGSKAHIKTSHLGYKEHRPNVSLLQTSYVGRTFLPSTSVVSDFSHNRSQQTAVQHTGATNSYAHSPHRCNRWKHEHRVPDDSCGWKRELAGSWRQCGWLQFGECS
jgi:hypothetical protein